MHGRDQLRRIERLDDPAGRAGVLAFALAVRPSFRWSASGSACGGTAARRAARGSARCRPAPACSRRAAPGRTPSARARSQRFLAIGGRVTSKPALPSAMRTMSRIDGESSAARMRIMRDASGCGRHEQRCHAEQARRVAQDARIAEPVDLALLRGAVAHEGAQQLHRGSVDALDAADVEGHAALPSSRCRHSDCFSSGRILHVAVAARARSWAATGAARGSSSFDNRSARGRRRALALSPSWYSSELVRAADFTDSSCAIGICAHVCVLVEGHRSHRHLLKVRGPAAAKLLKQFTAEQ